jgi:hypothetical protein
MAGAHPQRVLEHVRQHQCGSPEHEAKMAEAEALAVAIAGEGEPYRVAACWIVRDTKRNRQIIASYPEVFASTFTGSSAAWVRTLTTPGAAPPAELGLVCCDLRATRLFAWRRPAS